MTAMSIPWWEFIVRGIAVYVFLLFSLRISGKRQIGQLAPFDLVLLLVLSNSVQNSMNGGDNSLIGGMLSAVTLIALNHFVGYLTYKSKKAEIFLDGVPLILIRDGKLEPKTLDLERITRHELESAMRQAGVLSIEQVQFGVLEINGAISIVPKA